MMRQAIYTAAKRQLVRASTRSAVQIAPLRSAARRPEPSVQFFSDLAGQGSSAPARTSKDGVVGFPIDFDVNSKVEGNESQVGRITSSPFIRVQCNEKAV